MELDSLPLLIFSKECRDIIEFHFCVVGALFQCPDHGTLGNIMNSIFYLITDAMYCIRNTYPSFTILQREDLLLANFAGASHMTDALSILAIIPFIVASYRNFIPATM